MWVITNNHQWNADEKDETDEPEAGHDEVEEEDEDVILVDEQTVRCP